VFEFKSTQRKSPQEYGFKEIISGSDSQKKEW